MSLLSPALDAAFSADDVLWFGALTLQVGADTVRLLDGSSELAIGGAIYAGEDPVYGVWAGFEAFEDGVGDEAPGFTLAINPADDAAATVLTDPAMQGEAVRTEVGAVNRATGAVIGEPYVVFDGEIDTTRDSFGRDVSEVELECVGGAERFFFNDEGQRLAAAFHQTVWPGETGLVHVTGISDLIYWGSNTPTNAVISGPPWRRV